MIYTEATFLTVEDIAERVRDDMVARGIVAAESVLYGDMEVPRQAVAPKVATTPQAPKIVFRLAPGRIDVGDGGPPRFPGGGYDVQIGGVGPVTNHRSLYTVTDWGTVRIHATSGVLRGDGTAVASQRIVAMLRQAVLAALYRVAHGSLIMGGGSWLQPEQMEFKYGAAMELLFGVQVPVLDDGYQYIGTPRTLGGTMVLGTTPPITEGIITITSNVSVPPL